MSPSSLSKIRKIVLLTGTLLLLPICMVPISEAHLAGGNTKTEGDYMIQFDTSPSPPISETEIALIFSVQDRDEKKRGIVCKLVDHGYREKGQNKEQGNLSGGQSSPGESLYKVHEYVVGA